MRKASIQFTLSLVVLTALFFSCESGATTTASTATTDTAKAGLSIVHIMSDSLQVGYVALAQELARLEDNFTKAQENLGKEGAALQKEVAGLQNRAQQGLLSPKQIQNEQQRIGRKEQELRQKQEIAMNSIQQEQLILQDKFATQVRAILEDLKAENGYDYVLNQSAGSGVLVADPKHDITPMVLERLNALGENAMQDEPETVEE